MNVMFRKEKSNMTELKVRLRLMDEKEVAEKLGCTIDHVYLMIKYGNL